LVELISNRNPSGLEEAARADKGLLLALSYRLTGSVDDAEEIVQETFARAVEQPPPRTDEPWRPWLVRVATNLSLDALRRRKRRAYSGPWLPAPLALGAVDDDGGSLGSCPAARYEVLESVSFAFMIALEALGARQRAVLILMDVLDYSAREAAEVLGTSEGNARVVLHRARKAMEAYDRTRCRPSGDLQTRTREVLQDFVRCIVEQDVAGLEKLLAEDVRTVTDGGGEYTALGAPLAGRDRVMQLYLRIARRRVADARIEERVVNGLPAVLIEFTSTVRRQAPRVLLGCELDESRCIRALYAILSGTKLAALDRVSPR
jgi:RNA polymerase sigma-70 factor (ECF subfamily)